MYSFPALLVLGTPYVRPDCDSSVIFVLGYEVLVRDEICKGRSLSACWQGAVGNPLPHADFRQWHTRTNRVVTANLLSSVVADGHSALLTKRVAYTNPRTAVSCNFVSCGRRRTRRNATDGLDVNFSPRRTVPGAMYNRDSLRLWYAWSQPVPSGILRQEITATIYVSYSLKAARKHGNRTSC